jgi:hypothetical protein
VGDPGCVVAGVQNNQDLRITPLPLARRDEASDDLADLDGGDGREVGAGVSRIASSSAVHDVRPVSRAATIE